jgi:mono/diheme cytochrome c family protein
MPGFKSNMPRFANILSDREIWASFAYIKTQWPDSIQDRQSYINTQMDGGS